MSSRHNNNRQPRRNLSKVEQQLAAEQADRDTAIRQQRRREYLARKEKRERKSSSSSSTKTTKSDDRPAWMVERDRQRGKPKSKSKPQPKKSSAIGTFAGATFFVAGKTRHTTKSGPSQTLGQIIPGLEKQLNSLSFAPQQLPRARNLAAKVSKSAFAALDTDSEDDEEVEAIQGPSVGDKSLAQQQQSSSAWGGFIKGDIPTTIPVYQRKPPPCVTVISPEPEEEDESSESDSEQEQVGYDTDGDYESEDDFDEDEDVFEDGLARCSDSWDLWSPPHHLKTEMGV